MQLPDDTQHIAIVGRNGSGKTQAAVWHLSLRDFDQMPWVIYDYKRDELLARVPAQEITLQDVPDKPGLYIVHPLPDEEKQVEAHMWLMWNRGSCGIYVDEGFMVGSNNAAWDALLTQGRSKRIPIIVLSQRPVYLSRFVFSEASFYQIFFLNDQRDRTTVQSFVPTDDGELFERRLPPYYSYYYDVSEDQLQVLRPVPSAESILATFERRLQVELPEAQEMQPLTRMQRMRFI